MNKKIIIFLITIGVILVVLAFVRLIIGGPEDDWICVDGQWVEHGAPSISMPTEPCN